MIMFEKAFEMREIRSQNLLLIKNEKLFNSKIKKN